MNVKQLRLPELNGFKALEGWLRKLSLGIKEKQISGESLGVSETTVESWMERIKERMQKIWPEKYMEQEWKWLFFQNVACKGFNSEGKERQGWKNSKKRNTAAFLVSANGGKVGKPIVIWWSKKPRCFRLATPFFYKQKFKQSLQKSLIC